MLLECALLQECRDEYYTVDSLNALFKTIPETCIVEFLREAGFFYLIWCNLLTSTSPQTWTIWSDLSNCLENESNSWDTLTCVGRLICPEGHVSSLNKPNPTKMVNCPQNTQCRHPIAYPQGWDIHFIVVCNIMFNWACYNDTLLHIALAQIDFMNVYNSGSTGLSYLLLLFVILYISSISILVCWPVYIHSGFPSGGNKTLWSYIELTHAMVLPQSKILVNIGSGDG